MSLLWEPTKREGIHALSSNSTNSASPTIDRVQALASSSGMRTTVCSRWALVVRQVLSCLSCYATRTHGQHRDELKTSRSSSSARESASEWCGARVDADKGNEGPDSGEEDVLSDLGASYRAWQVYYREKRAHDYTKSRLVATFRREAGLLELFAQMGQSLESALMKLADLEAFVLRGEEQAARQTHGPTRLHDLARELAASKAQCQTYKERLHEANTARLNNRYSIQDAQMTVASTALDKKGLTRELRMIKRAAVLALNRQLVQRDGNKMKKRSYSSVEIV